MRYNAKEAPSVWDYEEDIPKEVILKHYLKVWVFQMVKGVKNIPCKSESLGYPAIMGDIARNKTW